MHVFRQSFITKMSEINLDDIFDDEWVATTDEHRFIQRQAKKPVRASDYLLEYSTAPGSITLSADRMLELLESEILYKDVGTLMQVCRIILEQKSNAQQPVWTYLKPYHLECLTYQIASAIQVGTITKDKYVQCVIECYKMVITSSKRHTTTRAQAAQVSVYTQWVAKAGEGMVNNLAIVYYFLKDECEIPRLPPFCKLS